MTMSSSSTQQVDEFFSSIEAWRRAYHRARLHFVAVESGGQLLGVSSTPGRFNGEIVHYRYDGETEKIVEI